MAKKYIVTGACVTHIPVAGPDGQMLTTLYQGSPLPEGVPEDRIRHLLDSNLIAPEGAEVEEALAEAYAPNANQSEKPADPKPKALDGRSSKADLVDHAVAQGADRADAEAMTKDELLDRYVRKPE